jgi:uncharacterized membrane protein
MKLRRILKHLFLPRWYWRRLFPSSTLAAIENVIREGEKRHSGEVVFAIETALDAMQLWRNLSARQRAIEVFSQLRVWDTEQNSGVLIYLLLANHDVEIVADRGAAMRIRHEKWEEVCRAMEAEFRAGRFEAGALTGIRKVNDLLAAHFPSPTADRNELPDKPVLL